MPPKKKGKKTAKGKKRASNSGASNLPSNQDGDMPSNGRATRSQAESAPTIANKRGATSRAKSPKAKQPKTSILVKNNSASAQFEDDGQEMSFDVHAHERVGDFDESSDEEV